MLSWVLLFDSMLDTFPYLYVYHCNQTFPSWSPFRLSSSFLSQMVTVNVWICELYVFKKWYTFPSTGPNKMLPFTKRNPENPFLHIPTNPNNDPSFHICKTVSLKEKDASFVSPGLWEVSTSSSFVSFRLTLWEQDRSQVKSTAGPRRSLLILWLNTFTTSEERKRWDIHVT